MFYNIKMRIQKTFLYEVLVVRAMTQRRTLSYILYCIAIFFFIAGQFLFFEPLNETKKLDDMHVLNGIFLKNGKRGKSIHLKIDDNKTWILCYLNWSQQCRLNMEKNKKITCYYTYDYSIYGWQKHIWEIRLPDCSLLKNYDYDVAKARSAFAIKIMAISLCISVAIIVIVFLINLKDKNLNCKINV